MVLRQLSAVVHMLQECPGFYKMYVMINAVLINPE